MTNLPQRRSAQRPVGPNIVCPAELSGNPEHPNTNVSEFTAQRGFFFFFVHPLCVRGQFNLTFSLQQLLQEFNRRFIATVPYVLEDPGESRECRLIAASVELILIGSVREATYIYQDMKSFAIITLFSDLAARSNR